LDEASLEFALIISFIVVLPLLGFLIKVVITPEFLHHLVFGNTEFGGIGLGKHGDGESPTKEG
jgi:hypothetical protein